MNYNRAALKNEVKEDLRRTRPKAILVSLVFLVVSYALSAAVELIQSGFAAGGAIQEFLGLVQMAQYGFMDEAELLRELLELSEQMTAVVGVGLVFGLISAVINWTLAFGYQGYCLDMVRGKNPGFGRLACAFPQWGWVLLTGLLVALFTALWSILLCIGGTVATVALVMLLDNSLGITLTIVVWLAVFACIIAISLRYSMSNYILLDEKVDSLEAISRSKAMMRGRKWHLFVLGLSFIGWYLLIGLIGGIVGAVGSFISMGAAFSNGMDIGSSVFSLLGGMSLTTVLTWLLTLPLMMWLQPYVGGATAKFYDWMKQTDEEHGVWESGNSAGGQAPSFPQYEAPEPPARPEPPAQPAEQEPPRRADNAPDRPNYE